MSCLGFFAKSTTSTRLINEIFPKGYKLTDENIVLNKSKITRLAEYAVLYPQYIPEIGEDINVALRKHLRAKHDGMVEAYITIFRGVLAKCCEKAEVMPFMQPFICNALMLLLRSTSTRSVCKASAMFFDYTELYQQCDVSLFLPVVLSLCDRNDYKVAHSEHEAMDGDQPTPPSIEELESCQMIGFQMLLRVIDVLMSYRNESILHNQLPNIIPCIWRAITSSIRDDSSVKQMGWDCLSLLATAGTDEALSLVLKGLIDLSEDLEWTDIDTIVDALVAVRDAAMKAGMHSVPVVQTLLAYAQSLIAPEITVSADNERGGLLGRLATVFAATKDAKQTPRLLTWVAGVLTAVELYMSRPMEREGDGGKLGGNPSFTVYCEHFEDDLESLLAIQLFLCVVSRHDYRIADADLPLPLVPDGAYEPAAIYRKLAEAIKSVDDATTTTGGVSNGSGVSHTNREQPSGRPSSRPPTGQDDSSSGTKTVDIIRSCQAITDESVTAVCKLAWRCVAMVAQYGDIEARATVFPRVLRYLEAAENRIRSLCERVAAGGGMVGMGMGGEGEIDVRDEDDHTMRLMHGRADDQVSVDGNALTISTKMDSEKGRQRQGGGVVEGLQNVCANVLTTFRVYVLYSMNILLTSSSVLCGPSLLDDGVLPLTGEAVCHLCLLIQAGDVSVTRQAVCVLIHLLQVRIPLLSAKDSGQGSAAATSSTASSSSAATAGSSLRGPSDKPWLPFTPSQLTLIRDAIFGVLCTCPSAPTLSLSAIAMWSLQLSLLRAYGVLEVLQSLPVLLTLEDYWMIGQEGADSGDGSESAFTAVILNTQRLYFSTYLFQLSRQFDCPGVRKLASGLVKTWGDRGAVPPSLSVHQPPSHSSLASFVVAELGGIGRNDVGLVLCPEVLHTDSPRVVAVEAINRAELLSALTSGGLRGESVRIGQAFEAIYEPKDDPYVRLQELRSVEVDDDDARAAVSLSHASLKARTTEGGGGAPSKSPVRSPGSRRSVHSAQSARSERSMRSSRSPRGVGRSARPGGVLSSGVALEDACPRTAVYAEQYMMTSSAGDRPTASSRSWLGQSSSTTSAVDTLLSSLDDLNLDRVSRQW